MDADKASRRIEKALRQKGIRITPQRMEIVHILSRDKTHPGAGAILREVRKRMPEVSMSTVYYTLGLLKSEGLIKELEFYDMENRYESVMTDHIDLVCTECGAIVNFDGDVAVTRQGIEESTGFEAHRMRFEYYGLCAKCRKKQS
jgi:Fur family transcriptional regulator, peroxide stress response regulator